MFFQGLPLRKGLLARLAASGLEYDIVFDIRKWKSGYQRKPLRGGITGYCYLFITQK